MAYFSQVSLSDAPDLDAFDRLRVSNPVGLFDSQFTYNLNPLSFEAVTAQSGAAVTHDATNRQALMTFASTPTGGKAYLQSYDCLHYQPGKSQLVYATFNFIETKANTLKFVGYSDGANGIELQLSGSTLQFVIYSDTTLGDQTITQANWNLDKFDGTGRSGLTLDVTKAQILVIDFQALYTGRVRVGFVMGGVTYYAHQFNHANAVAGPYIQSANLPIRAGMTCTGTVSTTMNFICCSVISEGGNENVAARTFSAEGNVTAATSRTHLLSIQPKTTFNSIANRIRFELDSVQLINLGSNAVLWELCIGQAISGTTAFTDVNTTYSGFGFNTAGTISGSPTLVIAAGYIGVNAGTGVVANDLTSRYPITLDAAGAVRSLGTLSLIVTAYTGTSVCRASMNWKEVR